MLLAALALLICAVSIIATAAGPDGPLPANRAFSAKIERIDADHIAVTWHIADGYYLYRHAFDFKLTHAGHARLGKASIPAGHRHKDAYFGAVETYRHRVRVRLPVKGPLPGDARVKVGYQGCADAGLCYPPQNSTLAVPAAAAGDPSTTESKPVSGTDTPGSNPSSRTDDLARRLGQTSLWSTALLFFVLGIGLAFTPCILPMIPIVAGMLGSRTLSRRRTLAAAMAYVVAMAAAYGVLGIIAAYFGANIQAALQRPMVLLPFAILFVVLAVASFGWFDLQLPASLQSRLSTLGRGRGGLAGAAALGFGSALIAGPCLAPPLAGALLYISTGGHVVVGAIALFALGLGIGMPLIALAVFGASILPRSGPWMGEVRVFFGVLLLAVGLWLALRLAPSDLALAAWGLLALVYGAYLSTRATLTPAATAAKRVIVLLLIGYAALAGAGLAVGNGHSTAPLAGLAATGHTAPEGHALFQRVTSASGLQKALAASHRAGQPAVVDFYADWCTDCIRMKHTVFTDARVKHALSQITAIEFDVTDYVPGQRRFMHNLGIFGPPTLLFYDASGQRRRAARLVGSVDAKTLISRIQAIQRRDAS